MSSLGFSEVVGLDVAKEALLLAAVEPRLGGVLLRGDKGSAKTTLARGLAAVLPGDAPFVELPLGAGEDRVLGALDLADLLGQGRPRLRPGLLADAHGGVLYIDEINLLADHLVDALLDVAVSGVNRVEREGLSEEHPARFVLVASMNPEEGELRPQLLDRFGLTTEVRAPSDVALRAEAVRRQLGRESCSSGDGGPGSIPASESDAALRTRVGAARALTPVVPGDVIELACAVSLGSGAEGLRADLSLVRAAGARARLDGRCTVTATDVGPSPPWCWLTVDGGVPPTPPASIRLSSTSCSTSFVPTRPHRRPHLRRPPRSREDPGPRHRDPRWETSPRPTAVRVARRTETPGVAMATSGVMAGAASRRPSRARLPRWPVTPEPSTPPCPSISRPEDPTPGFPRTSPRGVPIGPRAPRVVSSGRWRLDSDRGCVPTVPPVRWRWPLDGGSRNERTLPPSPRTSASWIGRWQAGHWWCSRWTRPPRWGATIGWQWPRGPCSTCSVTPTAVAPGWR